MGGGFLQVAVSEAPHPRACKLTLFRGGAPDTALRHLGTNLLFHECIGGNALIDFCLDRPIPNELRFVSHHQLPTPVQRVEVVGTRIDSRPIIGEALAICELSCHSCELCAGSVAGRVFHDTHTFHWLVVRKDDGNG